MEVVGLSIAKVEITLLVSYYLITSEVQKCSCVKEQRWITPQWTEMQLKPFSELNVEQ